MPSELVGNEVVDSLLESGIDPYEALSDCCKSLHELVKDKQKWANRYTPSTEMNKDRLLLRDYAAVVLKTADLFHRIVKDSPGTQQEDLNSLTNVELLERITANPGIMKITQISIENDGSRTQPAIDCSPREAEDRSPV